MNLLFVNMTPIYHNTSALIRMSSFISGAHKIGHKCEILTLESEENDYSYDPSRDRFVNEFIDCYHTFKRADVYGKVRQSKKNDNLNSTIRGLLRKLYSNLSIYDAQVINVGKVSTVNIDFDQYDRIISVSDPKSSHKLVDEISLINQITDISDKWIQCWGDPWYGDVGNRHKLVRRKVFKEESKYLEMAKRIVYTTPFTLEEQKNLFPQYASKMVWVNQAVKPSLDESKIEARKIEENIKVGYFGNYTSRLRNIVPLYETCKRNRHSLRIVGNGDINFEPTEMIEIIDMQSLATVERMENDTDILVCVCNRSGTQIPGKIYYSAGYQKPIILIVDGERSKDMKSFFESFHRYIICDNDENSIEKAIAKAKEDIRNNVNYKLDERFRDTYAAKVMLGEV